MKNIQKIGPAGLGFILAIGVFLGYLIFQTYSVFGPYLFFAGTFFILIGQYVFLSEFDSLQTKKDGKIIFNTKELPHLMAFLISVLATSLMYLRVNNLKGIISSEREFLSIIYIAMLTFSPVLLSLYRLFRDVNDFVEIDLISGIIRYRDNDTVEQFILADLESAHINEKEGITLKFRNGNSHEIPTYQMNISRKKTSELIICINKEIHQN